MRKTICLLLSGLFIFMPIVSLAIFYEETVPTWSESVETLAKMPNKANLELDCEAAILLDEDSGTILYTKNEHTKLRPASVTKIMTLLLIMEALEKGEITLNDKVPCSEKARKMGGSQIWLNETEELTVHEMLKAICVVSANDCSVAMAEFIGVSEDMFVQKMNEKAKELGMNDTTFKNCHGLDEDGHVTSSYDISLMSRELLQNHPNITNYTTIWMDSLRDGKSELVNTNKLIRTYDGATGLKTGSTSLALYNLSASATRNDLSLIAVVLRAPTPKVRFSEAKLLLDYGFSNYTFKKIATKGDIFQNISINKGTINNINLVFENDSGVLVKKNDSSKIIQEVELNNNLEAPISAGDQLGIIKYYINNELVSTVNLLSDTDVSKRSLLNTFNYISSNWINLLRNY